jgi:hypothetical protein
MRILAILIAVYTPAMLLIHLSTAKILKAWNGEASTWIKRRFSPRRALRIEAFSWLLALGAWPLWRGPAWKIGVALFSGIHLAIWLAGGSRLIHLTAGEDGHDLTGAHYRAIVAFDLIEAAVLVAVGGAALLYAV